MSDYKKVIKELEEERKALREKTAKIEKGLFEEFFKNFFSDHPEITSVSWKQYTPYFNDGDSCEFSVYDIEEINGEDAWGNETFKKEYKKVNEFIQSISLETMEEMLGDHVRVTVTPEGIETEDYDHD